MKSIVATFIALILNNAFNDIESVTPFFNGFFEKLNKSYNFDFGTTKVNFLECFNTDRIKEARQIFESQSRIMN